MRTRSTPSNRTRALRVALAAALALLALPPLGQAASAADTSSASNALPQVDAGSPSKLIDSAAGALLSALDAHREQYRHDPKQLDQLIDQVLLPHFDTEYSARLVLGTHWNAATPQQRQKFVDAFYHSMLNNYGDALLDFTANKLKVLPWTGDAKAEYATVRTLVRKGDGSEIAVNYSLHTTPQGWKVWDVVIEGISYVKSFRDDFSTAIDQHGIDAVIARLESGETPAAIKSTTGKG
jgi:phospholipid transport system substrate-binding protein